MFLTFFFNFNMNFFYIYDNFRYHIPRSVGPKVLDKMPLNLTLNHDVFLNLHCKYLIILSQRKWQINVLTTTAASGVHNYSIPKPLTA